jgi:hypothetical protein
MQNMIITGIIYALGFCISYIMLLTELRADKEIYTKGDRILNILLSLLSFFWVLVILIITWVKRISITGYWARPVVEEPIKPDAE